MLVGKSAEVTIRIYRLPGSSAGRMRASGKLPLIGEQVMSESIHWEYFARRAMSAMALAELAGDDEIAALHRQIAHSYLELVALSEREGAALHFIN
jgi:hypothetical protein